MSKLWPIPISLFALFGVAQIFGMNLKLNFAFNSLIKVYKIRKKLTAKLKGNFAELIDF